jgi:hypothetical protein
MSDIKTIIRKIESLELAIFLNATSNLDMFLQAVQENDLITELLEGMKSADNCSLIFRRVISLSKQLVDVKYENRWDVPLAVYVWALSVRTFQLSTIAASAIANTPRCWWALKVSINILNGSRIYNEAGLIEISLPMKMGSVESHSENTDQLIVFPNVLPEDEKIRNIVFGVNNRQGPRQTKEETVELKEEAFTWYDISNKVSSGYVFSR